MSTLKVIHTSSSWLPQTNTWLYNQIKYLPDDIESHILCERTQNLQQFHLPRIHSLEKEVSRARYYWEIYMRKLDITPCPTFFVSMVNKIKANILHSHFGNRGWQDLSLTKNSSMKQITTFYGWDVNKLPKLDPVWGKRYQELFSSGDLFLCEGSHMSSCLENLGCPREKLRVQHLGIEVEKIPFRPRSYRSGDPLRVLIAASFTEKKGIPYAIEALGKLSQNIQIELTLIGDANKGSVLSKIFSAPRKGYRELAHEKEKIFHALDMTGLMRHTSLLGYQSHKRLFEEAFKHHIFLSPSVSAASGDIEGGAPVSIIEMAATGMPVVSTTHCDIPEVLQYGENGWLAQERDVDGLVAIIEKWIEEQDRWSTLLSHARKHIEHEYDAAKQGIRLSDIYKRLYL